MRCAIYVRVSTDGQTIESQLEQLGEYAEKRGWKVYDTYEDAAISGAYLQGRAECLRLLDDLKARKINVVLCTEHSRVSRSEDPQERGLIMSIFKHNDVEICSRREGKLNMSSFSGELYTTLKLLMASEERKEIASRFKRGRRSKLRNGQFCLGAHQCDYGLAKTTRGRGKDITHEVVINEEEAEVLRTLCDLVVNEGKSLNACCRYLNDKGVATRRGKKWRIGSLSVILNNEALASGVVHTNRFIFKRVGTTEAGKPIQKLVGERPKDEWVSIEVPKIFTEEEYKVLREKLHTNKRCRMIKREHFLLRGKVKCGICGGRMVCRTGGRPQDRYYVCYNRCMSPHRREAAGIEQCSGPYVKMEALDAAIETDVLNRFFRKPKETLRHWATGADGHELRINRLQRQLRRIDDQIAEQEKESEKLLDAYLKDVFTKYQIKKRQDKIDATLSLLRDQRSAIQKKIRKAENLNENLKAVDDAIGDLKFLHWKLRAAFKQMSFKNMQKLLGYFVPAGSFVEVDDEGYQFSGPLKVDLLIQALKEYTKTGTISEPYEYTNFAYETIH